MSYLLVVAQGLFGLVVLTMPGMALLSIVNRRKLPAWPFAFALAASFVVSSLLVAGFQSASLSLLGVTASRIAAWALVLAALACAWKGGWLSVRDAMRGMGVWEARSVAVVAMLVLLWLLLMPLSPYPSHLGLDLGDPPAYYHAASNVVAGRGWAPDYFVGDNLGGTLSYLSMQPIPVLITTLFFQVFGTNWHSLYVYGVIAAGLLIYLLVSLVCLIAGSAVKDGRILFVLTLVVSLVPTDFLMFGLGVITAPAALAFLTVAAFYVAGLTPRSLTRAVIGISVVFLFWVRPESSLLAILLVVCGLVLTLGTDRRLGRAARWGLAIGCILLAVLLWASLPRVVSALPPTLKEISVFYVKLDPAGERFVPMYTPWWELARERSRVSFTDPRLGESLANGSLAEEVRGHPLAFLRYLAEGLRDTAYVFARTITVPYERLVPLEGVPSLAILGLLLALAGLEPRSRPVVAVVLGFLALMPLLNVGQGVRHILTVAPAVLGLSLRAVIRHRASGLARLWGRHRRPLALVGAAALCMLFALDSLFLVYARIGDPSRSYVSVLRDLQEVTSPGDVVVSSYPQLVTLMTGRRSVGATWLTENMDLIVRDHQPDFILVDNARGGPANYALLGERSRWTIPGYVPVVHNPSESYVIFRSLRYAARPPSAGNDGG